MKNHFLTVPVEAVESGYPGQEDEPYVVYNMNKVRYIVEIPQVRITWSDHNLLPLVLKPNWSINWPNHNYGWCLVEEV